MTQRPGREVGAQSGPRSGALTEAPLVPIIHGFNAVSLIVETKYMMVMHDPVNHFWLTRESTLVNNWTIEKRQTHQKISLCVPNDAMTIFLVTRGIESESVYFYLFSKFASLKQSKLSKNQRAAWSWL